MRCRTASPYSLTSAADAREWALARSFSSPLTCLFGHEQVFDPDDSYMPGLHPTMHHQICANLTTEATLHNKDCAAVGRNSFSKEVSYYADFSTGAQDTTYEACPGCCDWYKHYDYDFADTVGLSTVVLSLPLVHSRTSPGSSSSAWIVLPLLFCALVPGADAQVRAPGYYHLRSWAVPDVPWKCLASTPQHRDAAFGHWPGNRPRSTCLSWQGHLPFLGIRWGRRLLRGTSRART